MPKPMFYKVSSCVVEEDMLMYAGIAGSDDLLHSRAELLVEFGVASRHALGEFFFVYNIYIFCAPKCWRGSSLVNCLSDRR